VKKVFLALGSIGLAVVVAVGAFVGNAIYAGSRLDACGHETGLVNGYRQ